MKLDTSRLRTSKAAMPKLATDLWSDLRQRRLLPLVALLVVAIVATPFLLAGSGEKSDSATPADLPLGGAPTRPASLAVVTEDPGLRDYRRRLGRLSPKNPFRRHFVGPRVAGADLGGAGAATTTVKTTGGDAANLTSTPTSTSTTVGSAPVNSAGGVGEDGDPTTVKLEPTYVTYEVDVRVGKPGEMTLRRGIPELTTLPSKKNQAAVFIGASGGGDRALFLISSDVSSVFGDAKCGFGDAQCQLLELEPGFPVTLVYGAGDRRYTIAVKKIHRVEKPRRGSG